MQSSHEPSPVVSGRSRLWLATVALLALAAACYWYGIEHQSHFAQALFWILLLACPLMHVFGHRRHRHHHNKAGDRSPRQ